MSMFGVSKPDDALTNRTNFLNENMKKKNNVPIAI